MLFRSVHNDAVQRMMNCCNGLEWEPKIEGLVIPISERRKKRITLGTGFGDTTRVGRDLRPAYFA